MQEMVFLVRLLIVIHSFPSPTLRVFCPDYLAPFSETDRLVFGPGTLENTGRSNSRGRKGRNFFSLVLILFKFSSLSVFFFSHSSSFFYIVYKPIVHKL